MNRIALILCALTLPLPALAGGKRCAVAQSGIRTPGLADLAGFPEWERVPADVRLTEDQVEKLFDADRAARRALGEAQKLVEGLKTDAPALPENAALTDIVTASLFAEFRECAWVVDPETSSLFYLARSSWFTKDGKEVKDKACPVCVAVRKAMEAPFAYVEIAETSDAVRKAAALRQEAREAWVKAIKEALTQKQLSHLIELQERHLLKRSGELAEAGLRRAGDKACASCREQAYAVKCQFCIEVENAVKRVSE